MILVEPAQNDDATFADAVTLAGQIAALGHAVAIRDERMPAGLRARDKYEALPFLREGVSGPISALLVIGGQAADDVGLQPLRRIALRDDAPVVVFGQFADRQAFLTATAKFAYVTGREPVCFDLSGRPELAAEDQACPCFGIPSEVVKRPFIADIPTVLVWLADADAANRRAWDSLFHSRVIAPVIWTSSRNKGEWLQAGAFGKQIYALNELSPAEMARFSNILVVASDIGAESRVMCLINNMAASGGLVIDATPSGSLSNLGLKVLRGPSDPGFMHGFLGELVLPNIAGLHAEMAVSPYRHKVDLVRFLSNYGIAAPATSAKKPRKVRQKTLHNVLFMPTNGVGLGHARRCTLIAAELPKSQTIACFAAYPSCGPMIETCGFDWAPLVSKSALRESEGSNDILNSGRLGVLMAESDAFVFDGAFVFDSILRSIIRSNKPAAWIRRGLWPALQDNTAPLDRGRVFARIIVPGEAFAELNHSYSIGKNHFPVGPVVHRITGDFQAARQAIRRKLGVAFERLIVTMPGGGVATDMSVQVQTVCEAAERREDVLHLILVWPGALVPPVWHAWQRSRVVTTSHAAVLAAASDFIISAAGYNSFHEAMYNRIPAIFVPQKAPYLDDQTARAEAAASRGAAVHVEAGRLGALEREISRFLDHGKTAEIRTKLAALDLPTPGNRDAALRILELLP